MFDSLRCLSLSTRARLACAIASTVAAVSACAAFAAGTAWVVTTSLAFSKGLRHFLANG